MCLTKFFYEKDTFKPLKMQRVLMVAEKPSLAASLAQILSDGKAVERSGR